MRRSWTDAHERAGLPARPEDLIDAARLVTAYYTEHPDPGAPGQRVAFGTSGHRGSSLGTAFNEDHIAGDQPGDLRVPAGARAPTGRCSSAPDTHALSEPALVTRAGGVRRQRRRPC